MDNNVFHESAMPITKDKSVDAQFEQTILLEFDKIMITSGSTVDIDNTVKCPIISTVIPTNKYHTLILIDLGENLKSNKQICDQKKRTFVNSNPISAMKQTFALHWLIVNITYYSSGHEVKSYMGPQKSGHCYGLFFYEQDNKQNIDSKSYIGCSNRSKPYLFRFCKYVKDYHLKLIGTCNFNVIDSSSPETTEDCKVDNQPSIQI